MPQVDLLFKYYYRPLCLYAIHYLQDVDTAEDVVQDCFVNILEREYTEGQLKNMKSYLYTAVRNNCISLLRKQKNIDTNITPQDLDGEISDDEAVERSVNEANLWTAVDTLPERCREVLLMSKRDNMKYREIAEELGISEKTVENQIGKALKILRGKVEDFFYILFGVA
jgi:RNA polymerase sigma-70 factor (family 1)